MSKVSHQAKVFNMLKNANGPVPVEQLLSIEGLLPYKLSAYVLYAKIDFGAVIRAVRDGRRVVAYELVSSGSTPAPAAVAPKTRKSKPATKPLVVETEELIVEDDPIVEPAPAKMIASASDVYDILDEIDSDVESFEDRSYAQSYLSMR